MSLASFPAELFSAILSYVPAAHLQQTVLQLTRTLPRSSIPLQPLFHEITITHPDQVVLLNRRIRAGLSERSEDASVVDTSHWVHKLFVETWEVDANVLIDLVRLLPNLEALNIWIGPSNFEVEHLEELFSRHMPNLRSLSVRFRPYVQKASYLPFLKGAYFDNMLLALSKWPPSPQGLPALSIIIQDPDTTKSNFAQPIVFFRLDKCLSFLVHSPAASVSLKSLRLRIPGRNVVAALNIAYGYPNSLSTFKVTSPPIQLLDLAACSVAEYDIEALLARFHGIRHLILDGRELLRTGPGYTAVEATERWYALGRGFALASVKGVKDRERWLNIRLEAQRQIRARLLSSGGDPQSAATSEPRKARRGRRGLATATISLRDANSTPDVASSVPASSLGNSKVINSASVLPTKVRIVPPLPTLLSLSLHPTSNASIDDERRSTILSAFENGWKEGVHVIWKSRGDIGEDFKSSAGSNIKFMKFKSRLEGEGTEEEEFDGLEDVGVDDEHLFYRSEGSASALLSVPILCLAGDGVHDGHPEGCGHLISRDLWMDKSC